MIVADHVSKYYGERKALSNLTFTIERGEVVGLLGLNGAGKTTMLKILSGLLWPSSGRVSIDGVDCLDDPHRIRQMTGFLPDRPPLYPEMTVRGLLRFTSRLNGIDARKLERRLDEVLELCQLRDVAQDLIDWLSHGYRQRVGIAQAIAHEPALVILDEPIAGLDPEQIVGMRGLIRNLAESHTVLLSSHILSETEQTCDRTLVIHQGCIVAQGNETELARARAAGIRLTLRGSRESIETVLAGSTGLNEATFEHEQGGLTVLSVSLTEASDGEALVKNLVTAGIGIRRVTDVKGGGLESVFLELTRSEPQA